MRTITVFPQVVYSRRFADVNQQLQRGLFVQTLDYCHRLGGHKQAQQIQDLQHPLSASKTGISSTGSVVAVSCSAMHTPYRNFTKLSSFDRTKSNRGRSHENTRLPMAKRA
jgi:hypothetical protein